MKKSTLLSVISAVCIILLFSACSSGYEPAWKSKAGKASISISFSTMQGPSLASSSSDRAVFQGSGFLYIRTVGGPVGASGPLYGPFALSSGQTFETSEIPAGDYTNVVFIYTAKNVDAEKATYSGAEYTFRQLMLLSDDVFSAIIGDTNTEHPLDAILDGNATGKKYGPLTITESVTNSLVMTLTPITGSSFAVDMNNTKNITLVGDSTTLVRRFIRLANVGFNGTPPPSANLSDLVCKLSTESGAVISNVALYDSNGIKMPGLTDTPGVPGSHEYKVPYTAGNYFFFYIEYKALTVNLDFSAIFTGAYPLNVSFNGGDPSVNGKKMFFGLYDSSGMGPNGPNGTMLGMGMFTIAPDGTGFGQAYALGTSQLLLLPIGTTVYVSGFVDIAGNYSGITDFTNPAIINGMMPHYGDLAVNNLMPVTINGPGTTVPFNMGMPVCMNHVFFVAPDTSGLGTATSGSGSGSTIANACTLNQAITFANNAGGSSQIYLTGVVIYPTMLPTVSSVITIMSLGNVSQTLSLTHGNSPFYLGTGSELTLANIIIDGNSVSRYGSLFSMIVAGSTCTLANGVVIKNVLSNGTGNGGAFTITGSTLNIVGGSIMSCSVTAGNNGGAIVLNSGTINMIGGSISGNTAANNGGGVYMAAGAFTMTGGAISNNTATNGAGIYIAGGVFTMTGGSISGNTTMAAGYGGGLFLYAPGIINFTSATPLGAITSNTATTEGGGLYWSTGTVNFNGISCVTAANVLALSIFSGNTAPASANVGP